MLNIFKTCACKIQSCQLNCIQLLKNQYPRQTDSLFYRQTLQTSFGRQTDRLRQTDWQTDMTGCQTYMT